MKKAATARVFFALWPDRELAGDLAATARECAGLVGGRPTRQETIHLTLVFVGEVAETCISNLLAVAQRVRGPHCRICLDRLGYWRHNRLLWAGGEAPPGLNILVRRLRRELDAAGIAYADGGRAFVPHLTLVRKVLPSEHQFPGFLPREWHVSRFVLVRSCLSPQGPDYQLLGEWPLIADGSEEQQHYG